MIRITSQGNTISDKDTPTRLAVVLHNDTTGEDGIELGRIIAGRFRPATFCTVELTPDMDRAIDTLIQQRQKAHP